MSYSPTELKKRFDILKANRTTVEDLWKLIEKFVTPYRGDFTFEPVSENAVDWYNRDVYDSTAINSHQTLSASLHGGLTSPSIRWFDLRFRSEQLNSNKQATKWLQEVAAAIFFELQDSNFNLNINEAYQDIAGLGTSATGLEEGPTNKPSDWGGLEFTAIPVDEIYFEPDAFGRVRYFYRHLRWTAVQLESKFGKEALPEVVKAALENATQERFTVLYTVSPTGHPEPALGKKVSDTKRPFKWCYFMYDTGDVLDEGGYYEMPVYITRWRTTAGSMWGNSPAMAAMGDILTLNQARKMQLVAAEKMIDPPIFVEERAILSDLDLNGGTISHVRDIQGIKAFATQGNIPISDVIIKQLQDSIKDTFFASQLQFPPTQGTPMSATEAQIRYEQLQKLLGPTLGRLQNDLLDPIVERTFKMMARKGMLPEPPQIVQELDPAFDVQYMGALARAQRVDNAAAIERWVGLAANLSQVLPDVLDVVDAEKMIRAIGKDLNIPADIYRDKEEVQAIQQQRQAQEQQMMAAQSAQMEGEAMKAQGEGQQALSGE